MPYIEEMRGITPGGTTGRFLQQPIVIREQTSGGEVTQTTTLAETVAETGVTFLAAAPPTAASPTEGLPANARQGKFYSFTSRPDTLYVLGADNVWRASLLVAVV